MRGVFFYPGIDIRKNAARSMVRCSPSIDCVQQAVQSGVS